MVIYIGLVFLRLRKIIVWYKGLKLSSDFSPDFPYGYWVGPDGKSYPVLCERCHLDVLNKILPQKDVGYLGAYRLGFIRVMMENECGAENEYLLPSEIQIGTLSRIFGLALCPQVHLQFAGKKINGKY